MHTFEVRWKRVFSETYGHDHDVVTEKGSLFVHAPSHVAVMMEIAKFDGCSTNYRERIIIESITENKNGQAASIKAIGFLMDPYNIRETR